MQLIAVLHAPGPKVARPPRVRVRKHHPFGTWPGCQQTGPKVTPSEIPTTPGTVAAAIGNFIAEKRGMGRSNDTLQNYRGQLAKFTAYLHRQGLGELETRNLTKDVVRGYLADCRTNGMPYPTLALGANILKIWLHWAEEVGLVPDDLTYRLRMPTARPVTIEPLSMEQIRALLEATEQTRCPQRDRAILMVMADTGVRASELCGMKDADMRDDRVRVFGKGAKFRWVPLSPEAVEAIDDWRRVRPRAGGYLFVSCSGRPLTRRSLYELFKRLGSKAGITGVRCSPHDMRHSFACEWLRAGGDLATLQQAMGHSQITMTARYLTVLFDDVAATHQRCSIASRMMAPSPRGGN